MNGNKLPTEGHGYIYKLYNLKLDVYYIGQTTTSLNIRLNSHKNRSKTATNLLHRTMRESDINDWYMAVVIEEPLETLHEAERETIQMYVANTTCLNKQSRLNDADTQAHRQAQKQANDKTYGKTYRDGHKVEIQTYRDGHKEKIRAYNRTYYQDRKALKL